MAKILFRFIVLLFSLPLMSCSSEKSNGGSNSSFSQERTPGDISVVCTPAMSPQCDLPSDGREVYFIWATSRCEALAQELEQEAIAAIGSESLECEATGCEAVGSSPWVNFESPSPITKIPGTATTAAAWLNLADNGASDEQGPQTGDVVCCAEDQDANVELTNADCVPIF